MSFTALMAAAAALLLLLLAMAPTSSNLIHCVPLHFLLVTNV
jgi:hypothetical protein